MPNLVDNRLEAYGPATEIERFLATCFRMTDPGQRTAQFDFASIIPLDADPVAGVSGRQHPGDFLAAVWGTKSNAVETRVERRSQEAVEVHFVTPWDFPEPVYRALGPLFPALSFRVEAIDPDLWAVDGRVDGSKADFGPAPNFEAVFDRFYSVCDDDDEARKPLGSGDFSLPALRLRIIERRYP
jgi:hypothetical protein